MLVWLIEDGESLPVQPGARRMRTGMLAAELVGRGHSVVWWSSTFSHQRKTLLYRENTQAQVQDGFKLELIYAGQYRHNISYQRYRHHCLLAKNFRQQARSRPVPGAIVCGFPIIDLAYEAVSYARTRNVPVIIDVRDLWPDVFIEKSPRFLKSAVKMILRSTYSKTRYLLQNADSILAVSQSYLTWALAHAGRIKNERDKVLHLGYDDFNPEHSHPTERLSKLRWLIDGKIVFTFIGSFGHSYELKLICEVAREVVEMGFSDIHFVLAGDGEQYTNISRRVASLPNVTLLGWLNDDELRELLGIAHVGLVPCVSAVGTIPNKPFEYLSAGLPIISSLEGDMVDIISQNDVGFSYRRGDTESLRDHVIKLATNRPLRERQALNAKALFVREFRAKAIYHDYANHIEEITKNKQIARNQRPANWQNRRALY